MPLVQSRVFFRSCPSWNILIFTETLVPAIIFGGKHYFYYVYMHFISIKYFVLNQTGFVFGVF